MTAAQTWVHDRFKVRHEGKEVTKFYGSNPWARTRSQSKDFLARAGQQVAILGKPKPKATVPHSVTGKRTRSEIVAARNARLSQPVLPVAAAAVVAVNPNRKTRRQA